MRKLIVLIPFNRLSLRGHIRKKLSKENLQALQDLIKNDIIEKKHEAELAEKDKLLAEKDSEIAELKK